MNKKAVLFSNLVNDTEHKTAKSIARIFKASGWETSLCAYPEKPDLTGAGMLITFGGDGTILHGARYAAGENVPILGINMGGKGFIAELEPDDEELIEKIPAGEYELETRMMIDIEILRAGELLNQDYALNDVVIKGDNKAIEMSVYADSQRITRMSGDGVIVATPTGSTAYSMSAGGPIVEPSAKNIIITPICAHMLDAKSFVLVSDRIVTVKTEHKKEIPAYVSTDGGSRVSIQSGDVIKIKKSDKTTSLVRLSGKSFYHRLTSKLISRD